MSEFVSQFSLNDRGTRYQHYREILDLWEAGLEIMNARPYLDDDDKARKLRLEAGVLLLERQIDIMSGFNPHQFSDAMYPLKNLIDSLPRDQQQIT